MEFIRHFLLTYPEAGYVLTFVAAFLESFAFVGVVVPGTAIVVVSGFVAEQLPQALDVRGLLVLAALGVFLGSATSYLVGRYYGPPLFLESGFFGRRRYLLVKAQRYFAMHGGKSVFTGHFFGPIRSLVSFVAGMAEMHYLPFLAYTFASALAWSFVHVGLGYMFGTSWELVQLWGTRLTVFLGGIAVIFLLNWVLGRFLVRHERQVRAFFISVGHSVGQALIENEYIAGFLSRHPRVVRFVQERLSPYHVFGLALTVSVTLGMFILGYFIELVADLFYQGSVAGLDSRLLGLVTFVRDPILSRVMLYVTILGGVPVGALVVAVAMLLVIRRAWARLVVLLFGPGGAYVSFTALKWLFARPRPDVSQALLIEHSASFPSGHATISFVFYGYLAYLLLRYVQSWRTKVVVVLTAVFAVGLIGLSRLYLGVHWPSDVLGGYLLGAWFLLTMIMAVYLWESTYPEVRPPRVSLFPLWLQSVVVGCAVVVAVGGYLGYIRTQSLRTVSVGSVEILPRQVVSELTSATLASVPHFTETWDGTEQVPVDLVLIGSYNALVTTFAAADWRVADPITLQTAIKIIQAALANASYPTAPISPSFYNGRVQDIGVEQETPARTARERHHARFWLAPVVLSDGRDVWFGTTSFDRGLAYSSALKFPTHTISPDIDRERDYVVAELTKTGRVTGAQTIDWVTPVIGRSGTGDLFFTDGKTRVVWLRPAP